MNGPGKWLAYSTATQYTTKRTICIDAGHCSKT